MTTIRNANIINAECRNSNQPAITKELTSKDMKSYFGLTIVRISIKENTINILKNIKELLRHFKKMK